MAKKGEQIYHCYNHALDWLDKHRELFNPLTSPSDDPSTEIYLTKALGELGLLCMLTSRSTKDDLDPRIEHCLQLLLAIWQQSHYYERVVRRPEYFQMYTMIYLVLQQCGIIPDTQKALIQQVIDQGYVLATETTPMRLLDRRHMLDCGQFRHDLPSYAELYQQTLLAQTPELVYLTDTDIYAITHTIFYLTDFGRISSPFLQGDHLTTIRGCIETLLGVYIRHKNWDLVGELLLDCYCLHWYPEIIFDLAWTEISQHQLPDGSVPGPRYSQEKRGTLDDTAGEQYCFEENYHTTIVNALAGILIYHDGETLTNQTEQ